MKLIPNPATDEEIAAIQDDHQRELAAEANIERRKKETPMKTETPQDTRTHRCMRCNEEFPCRHGPNCAADYSVLPNIVNLDGRGVTEHCPSNPDWNWIRAYGERIRATERERAAKIAETYYDDMRWNAMYRNAGNGIAAAIRGSKD